MRIVNRPPFDAVLIVALLAIVTGCAASGPYQIDLMPAPDVYNDEMVSLFVDPEGPPDMEPHRILYATDRVPAGPEKRSSWGERFYVNERGHVLRVGFANVALGESELSWEDALRITFAQNRSGTHRVRVTDVHELGILDRSLHPLIDSELREQASPEPAREFAARVNDRLANSQQKDIFIFVHGFRVVFDNPVLVASELWHFLGYQGVFMAFAWPSTPSGWAYFADAETTSTSAYQLSTLLEYLADETDAERIHVVGYSQGTRLVVNAMYRLALKSRHETPEEVGARLRIGNVILVGSDIDTELMGTYLIDGLLDVMDTLTIYVSERDKALGFSRFLLGRRRLGEMFPDDEITPDTLEYLRDHPQLQFVNVTEAEGALRDNGHGYFRKSPWVSSDVLVSLRYGMTPAERGLVYVDDAAVWTFPPGYIDRLRAAIVEANPAVSAARDAGADPGSE